MAYRPVGGDGRGGLLCGHMAVDGAVLGLLLVSGSGRGGRSCGGPVNSCDQRAGGQEADKTHGLNNTPNASLENLTATRSHIMGYRQFFVKLESSSTECLKLAPPLNPCGGTAQICSLTIRL